MTERGSLLVCILPDLEGDVLRRFVTNAASFAKTIGVDVHFLTPANAQEALNSVVTGLHVQGDPDVKAVFHSIGEDWPPRVVLEALNLYSCDLIAVPGETNTGDGATGSQIRKVLLEQASVPLLILSPEVDLRKAPLGSLLVPMSGEIRISSALSFGLNLAARIHVPVDLLHVVTSESESKSRLDTTGDQPHHEIRERLDQVLAEGSPFSGAKEKALVRTLYDVQGTPSTEILKISEKSPSCAIIAEWHGSLIHGKAETLKGLLHQLARPLFLVKAVPEQKSTLKIGPDTRVA